MQEVFTTREVAEKLGTARDEWKVRRLFEDGTLPEPKKFGGKRIISAALIPAIEYAFRERGWLPIVRS